MTAFTATAPAHSTPRVTDAGAGVEGVNAEVTGTAAPIPGLFPSADPASSLLPATTVFEHPLHDRIRLAMRLEFLFDQYWQARRHLGDGDAPGPVDVSPTDPERLWAARASVHALLDLVHVIGQTDFRPELTRELNEQLARRDAHGGHDGSPRGSAHASRLQAAVEDLKGLARYPTVPLRNHEMLGALISRMGVAGGSTPFDMPQFQRWLGGTGTSGGIETDLDGWMAALGPLDDAVHAWLGALRASAPWDDAVTTEGAFMHRPPVAHVLLRVRPRTDAYYPEISAGRHRYHIRFLDPRGFATRPVAVAEPVAFAWQACL